MHQEIKSQHFNDENDNPAGGTTEAIGLSIRWQNGPIPRNTRSIPTPNGAFVETVIRAALDRLQYYQKSKFNCRENSLAITKLEEALLWLGHRTANREARGVEGTHKV